MASISLASAAQLGGFYGPLRHSLFATIQRSDAVHLQQIHTGPGFLGAASDSGRTAPLRAHIMLRLARRDLDTVERDLADLAGLTALHQISGDYDLVVVVEAAQPEALDALIARIIRMRGVTTAMTSRLLPSERETGARSFAA